MNTASPVADLYAARLTPREQQIYHYLLTGVSNKRTAYELGISQRTVETHRSRIYRKFGVRSAMQLLAMVASESRFPPGVLRGLAQPSEAFMVAAPGAYDTYRQTAPGAPGSPHQVNPYRPGG